MFLREFKLPDLSLIKFYLSDDLSLISIQDAKSKIIEKGGIIRDEITNDLWYFVANNPHPKKPEVKRAKELGVLFITEDDFLKMLK